ALPHDPDRLFPSWLGVLMGAQSTDWGDEPGIALGEGLFWASMVVSALISFLLFGRGQDHLTQSLENSPRLNHFLKTGYSIERVGHGLVTGLGKGSDFVETWLNQKLSVEWIPRGIVKSLSATAYWINRADQKVYAQEESILRKWIDVPAKALQLIQN